MTIAAFYFIIFSIVKQKWFVYFIFPLGIFLSVIWMFGDRWSGLQMFHKGKEVTILVRIVTSFSITRT